MVDASSTFVGPGRGDLQSLWGFSVCAVPGGEDPVADGPANWPLALGARGAIEAAVLQALTGDGAFPWTTAEAMRRTLPWDAGLALILERNPSSLRLKLGESTCVLLPELVPVVTDMGQIWLDRLLPIHRTLDHVTHRPVVSHESSSLAILHQDEADFRELALAVGRQLRDVLRVQTFTGEYLADRTNREARLQEIFFEHRAVLFLGHLLRRSGQPSAWQLTDRDGLDVKDLHTLLGGSVSRGLGITQRTPTPEIVVTACCSGAWGDVGDRVPVDRKSFFPFLFLDSGVRFFIGSWMDVFYRSAHREEDLGALRAMLCGFFRRWVQRPDDTVQHLHAAKSDAGFHLLTALFQIYQLVEPVATLPGARARALEPAGALAASVREGRQLGDYALGKQLWEDLYGTTYWATRPNHGSNHLLQVLSDDWQVAPGLGDDLTRVVVRLRALNLGDGHLVPARVEQLALPEQASEAPHLLVLVYDRPQSERAEDWSCLANTRMDRGHRDHFQIVLTLGAQVSVRLWQLHSKRILHGNLHPKNVVFLRSQTGERTAWIKDVWVQLARPGRCTEARYAAPDEPSQEGGADQFKLDCWGLGVVLFELATGGPPERTTSIRDAVGELRDLVPEGLDRVVRECLVPATSLRPTAETVVRRLTLALKLGGTYVAEIEEQFELHINAGHRLFAVQVDDIEELETVLLGMQAHPRAYNVPAQSTSRGGDRSEGEATRYRLYVAAEDVGVTDRRTDTIVLSWQDAREARAAVAAAAGRDPGPLTADQVAAYNGLLLLDWAASMSTPPDGAIPILLIHGMHWWESREPNQMLFAWRVLKSCQRERGFPVVVVADSVVRPIGDVGHSFVVLGFPPLSPAELFERILAAPEVQALPVPRLTPDEAASIAWRLFPCSARELKSVLRACALRYGRLDDRAVEIREEERSRQFQGFGVATYTPFSRLPAVDLVAWPPPCEETVQRWIRSMAEIGIGQRRLLLLGPSGSGKSFAARVLAGALRLPLVRLEATRCLQGQLGASEMLLRIVLAQANFLGACAVLLDDIDRFLAPLPRAASSLAGTLGRLSSILLDWLDTAPPAIVVLMTAADESGLSPQWRRRSELRIPMAEPAVDGNDQLSMNYRARLFQAFFRKFGLGDLATDGELADELARRTHPALYGAVPAPTARLDPRGRLGALRANLRTGADIEAWISETILFHASAVGPEAVRRVEFWRAALRLEETITHG